MFAILTLELTIRIYSVGVWNNKFHLALQKLKAWLEFTPLEFETRSISFFVFLATELEFTPLEFETFIFDNRVKVFSKLEFTPLEFETLYPLPYQQ